MKDEKITYLGNPSLLNLPKTAFMASSTIPLDMVLRCYDWAVKMRDEGCCVISGFSSRLEKDVWDFLKEGRQPIILVLAREMYKQIPIELQTLLDSGRLLIISTSSASRQSKATAFTRNRYICEQAEKILFIGVNENSSLFPLLQQFHSKCIYL